MFAGIIAGEVNVAAAQAFVKAYAAALKPAEASSFMLGLLRFYSSNHALKLAQPVLLQTAVTVAQAVASAVCGEDDSAWHEEVMGELKLIAHHLVQDRGSQQALTGQLAGLTLVV